MQLIQYNITELTGRNQKVEEGKGFTLESFTRCPALADTF